MNLTIYTSNLNDNIDNVSLLRSFLYQTNNYDDFFLCVDIMSVAIHNISTLNPFYLSFFKGDIVFLSLNDYIEYKDKIIGNPILFIPENDIQSKISVDQSFFNGCQFILKKDDKLIMVNNYAV